MPKVHSGGVEAVFDENERLRGRAKQREDLLGAILLFPLERQFGREERRPPPLEPTRRALIPIAAPRRTESMPQSDVRATAPFLAHLIATVQGAPQTRTRRRADADQAVAAYTAMMQTAAHAAHAVSQTR